MLHQRLSQYEVNRLFILSNRHQSIGRSEVLPIPSPGRTTAYFLVLKPLLCILITFLTMLAIWPGIFLMINWFLLLACNSSSMDIYDFRTPTVCHRWLNIPAWGDNGWIVGGLPGSMITIPLVTLNISNFDPVLMVVQGALYAYVGSIFVWILVVRALHSYMIDHFDASRDAEI